MLWLLLACRGGLPAQALEQGEWTLQGEEVMGILQVVGKECNLGLWGPTYRTGEAAVGCQSFAEGDRIELLFYLEFGAGSASASAWTTREMKALTLPLGSRPGEHEIRLRLTPQLPSSTLLNAAMKRSAEGFAASKAMWDRSVFRIEDRGRLVGELFLPAERSAEIQLYGPGWMTRGRVKATLAEKGPDLWLSFEIMPSLDAESGLLLVNRATNQAVLPLSNRPLPGELSLQLKDGPVHPEERAAAEHAALAEGLEKEKGVMEAVAKWAQSQAKQKGCPTWAAMEEQEPELALSLRGYAVSTQKEEEDCVLRLDPRPIQHGRRLSIRVSGDGLVEAVERALVF
jgi:hypothetical protein